MQLLKKLTQCGDTSCLRPLLAVASLEDRALLQKHCHSAATRILESQREEPGVREAVAYLSVAIMASGEPRPFPKEGRQFFTRRRTTPSGLGFSKCKH